MKKSKPNFEETLKKIDINNFQYPTTTKRKKKFKRPKGSLIGREVVELLQLSGVKADKNLIHYWFKRSKLQVIVKKGTFNRRFYSRKSVKDFFYWYHEKFKENQKRKEKKQKLTTSNAKSDFVRFPDCVEYNECISYAARIEIRGTEFDCRKCPDYKKRLFEDFKIELNNQPKVYENEQRN